MVQASISNARDFDRVAEALIIQHPRIHLRENQRRTKGKGKDGFKRVDKPNTRWFREKGKRKIRNECSSRAPHTPLRITIITTMKTWMNLQTPNMPTIEPVDPGSDDG